MKTVVFCDFDGTVTRRDVGYNMFHHFSNGKNDELMPDWKSGRISSRECLLAEAEMITVSRTEIDEYLQDFEIDPGFGDFVDQCETNGIDLNIVSDGLDFYMKYILQRNKLSHLKIIANHARIEDNRMIIEFPYDTRSCTYCGNCKAERIQDYRAAQKDPCQVVFVGDGYSDKCAVKEADLLFAKKDLERYCLKNDIPHIKYNYFFDVIRHLHDLKIFD